MKQIHSTSREFKKTWQSYLQSAASIPASVEQATARIVREVRRKGDMALLQYTRKYDRFAANGRNIEISSAQIKKIREQVPPSQIRLLKRAANRIRLYHRKQWPLSFSLRSSKGRMGLRWMALDSVGLYVPGGQAAYPSTVLMNAIPAQVAGVKRIAMVSPTPDGIINPYTIAAASVVGIEEIYRIGGAQAVAALAYGTQSIPAVDKIVGPGNIYVAAAKRQVFGQVDIDMIAGPTEVLVIADSSANPEYVASDLLSQAEHDPDARPVLVSTSRPTLEKSLASLEQQLRHTPRRQIARKSIRRNGMAILAKNASEAVGLANELAAEHLVLMVRDTKSYLAKIRHAGAIFVGPYAPVAAGDYTAGPNHVLPTARTARFASPLGVYDFVKASSRLELSRKGLAQLAPDIVKLADLEGLTAHGDSVRLRLGK